MLSCCAIRAIFACAQVQLIDLDDGHFMVFFISFGCSFVHMLQTCAEISRIWKALLSTRVRQFFSVLAFLSNAQTTLAFPWVIVCALHLFDLDV